MQIVMTQAKRSVLLSDMPQEKIETARTPAQKKSARKNAAIKRLKGNKHFFNVAYSNLKIVIKNNNFVHIISKVIFLYLIHI